MTKRPFRVGLAAGALTAVSALVVPGTAHAVILAGVGVRVDGNTIRTTITVPGTADSGTVCFGPLIHTEDSARRIQNSPDLDLEDEPGGWSIYMPDSPSAGMRLPGRPYRAAVSVTPGQSAKSVLPAVAPGKHVAGVLCGVTADSSTFPPMTYTSLHPRTVGVPDQKPPAAGSLGSLSFGS